MSGEESTNKYIIRSYRHGDFPGIEQLWISTDLGGPQRGDNEKIIEDSIKLGGQIIIMEEMKTGIICGTSWMTFDGRRIHLHHFGILPDYQGLGLSNDLLSKSLEFVKEMGYQVKLEVNKENLRAISLYKKYGFKALGNYDVYIIRDISK